MLLENLIFVLPELWYLGITAQGICPIQKNSYLALDNPQWTSYPR